MDSFVMPENMQAAMAEATRLTVAGRLAEATALIQQTLRMPGNRAAPEVPDSSLPLPIPPGPDGVQDTGAAREAGRPPRTQRLSTHIPDIRRPTRRRHKLPCTGSLRLSPLVQEPRPVGNGGQFTDGFYTNAAGTRAYKLYIPSDYTDQAVPLVVLLHGGTQTAADFATATQMNRLAEQGKFLVVYPEQPSSANPLKCWNWFQAAHQHRDAGEPSLIAGITRQIMTDYHVDARRVYIAGFSAGAAMAVITARVHPDLYAAVGVHSGLAYGAAHNLPSALTAMKHGTHSQGHQPAEIIPLIVFHGDRDETVAVINADCIRDDWRLARPTDRPHDVRRSAREASVERGQVPGGRTYTRRLYPDATGGTIVEQWIIHGAGHAWSGGSPQGSYVDPKGPDASAELIRFFDEHPKQTP